MTTNRTALKLPISRPQSEFVGAVEPFPALCAGFGAGKTVAGVIRALTLKCKYPKLDVGYYLPTYDLVKTVGYPAFFEVMELMGMRGEVLRGDRVIEVYGAGNIIFRSMENPEKIVGYKHADAVVDELDTLPTDKAREVYRKILGRNRQKKPDGAANSLAAVSTPEGFKFFYENWQKKPPAGARLIRASTYSNRRNLPPEYIPQLLANYPTQLIQAYLMGYFVNLTSGSVYPEFSRTLNATFELIREREPLHIGMDFNVGNMTAVVHVQRQDEPYALDEVTGVLDTPAMCKILKERYQDKGHQISVYPDASASARKSNNASESDLALLRQAKFSVCVNSRNPAVKDRVLAVNKVINCEGVRKYHINPDTCPVTVEDLEKQAYDENGEPDKKSGHDHRPDAVGYYVNYRWPIKRPVTVITSLRM